MKLYSLDQAWMGGSVVVANSRDEAWALITKQFTEDYPSDPGMGSAGYVSDDMREWDIELGTLITFAGDH